VSLLPKGWLAIELKSVCKFIDYRGKTPKKTSYGLPLITAKNIRNGFINREPREFVSEGSYDDWMVRGIPEVGDILITTEAPLGNVASIDIEEKFVLAQRAICLQMFDKAIDRFVQYFLRSPQFQKQLHEQSTGSTVKGIKSSRLKEMKVCLAPLKEQIRIVGKLDSMLAKVDAAQTSLDKIPLILKRYRQSVLAAATSGELTKEWRDGIDIDWPLVSLKDVGTGFNYGSSAKSQNEGDVPVLRMGNLQGGDLDWKKLVFTSDKKEIEKYLLSPGDVLFNRTNSPELVGKTSIFRGEQKAIFAGYLIRVRGSEYLDTEYLNIQLNTPHAKEYCWRVKTDGVSQSNINAKKLQAYEFHLPTIEEQQEITRRVESLFAMVDTVEKQYNDTKAKTDKLTQSILAKAFSGKLVPQDSSDESAQKLLDRILSNKENKTPVKPRVKAAIKPKHKVKVDNNIDKAAVKEWIENLEVNTFSSDDLNSFFGSDYDLLKDILFSLLRESKPMVNKVFDAVKKEFIFKKV
jgi:type I restriction enzyme S subunit